jgi:hypothetical protein
LLLGLSPFVSAQTFEECDKPVDGPYGDVGCVALEISEQIDGVRVEIMHFDGGFFGVTDDEYLRELMDMEPEFYVQLEPYYRIGIAMNGFESLPENSRVLRHYGRTGAPVPELFTPIATRSFSSPIISEHNGPDCQDQNFFPFVVVDELGFWINLRGEPIWGCEGSWALFEGSFRSLGIIPDVLSIWSSERHDYKFRTVATASLTIVHRAEPADGADFTYTVGFSDETDRTEFVLDDAEIDDGDAIGDTYVLDDPVLAGTYEIAHDQSTGIIESAACTGGGDPGSVAGHVLSVEVRGTEDVVCEVVTSKLGRATVNLERTPESTQAVTFSGDLGEFALTDDGVGSQPAYSLPLAPGSHDVNAAIPEGWELTGLSCDDGNSTVDPGSASVVFVIEPDESVACTFMLTQLGSVAVELAMTPESDQPVAFSGDFGSFSLDGDGGTALPGAAAFSELQSGVYAVEAVVPSGWHLVALGCSDDDSVADTGAALVSVSLAPGEAVTCVFSLVQRGSVAISLDLLPDSDQAVDFSGDLGEFSLDDDSASSLPGQIVVHGLLPGEYGLAVAVPDGWNLTNLDCDDANSTTDPATATAALSIDAGDNVSCSVSLTQQARLTVALDMLIDHSVPIAFSGDLGEFLLVDDGEVEPARAFEVEPGSYTITAASPEGWSASDLVCTLDEAVIDPGMASAQVELTAGSEARCTWSFAAAVADLAINGRAERDADDPDRVSVWIDVTNHGPAPASNVQVSGSLSGGTMIEGGECGLQVATESLSWMIGPLLDQATTRCEFLVELPPTRDLNLELSVAADQEDTVPATNVALFGLMALAAIPVPALGWAGALLLCVLLSATGLILVRKS